MSQLAREPWVGQGVHWRLSFCSDSESVTSPVDCWLNHESFGGFVWGLWVRWVCKARVICFSYKSVRWSYKISLGWQLSHTDVTYLISFIWLMQLIHITCRVADWLKSYFVRSADRLITHTTDSWSSQVIHGFVCWVCEPWISWVSYESQVSR